MPKEIQAPQEVVAERLDVIKDMLVRRLTRPEIIRCVAEKHDDWGIGRRMTYYYIDRALQELAEESDIDRAAEFTMMVYGWHRVIARADKMGDLSNQIRAMVELSKLLQLDKPQHELNWREQLKRDGLDPDEVYQKTMRLMAKISQDDEEEIEPDEAEFDSAPSG